MLNPNVTKDGELFHHDTCQWGPFIVDAVDSDDHDKMYMVNNETNLIAVVEHLAVSQSKIDYIVNNNLAGVNWWSLSGKAFVLKYFSKFFR